jgi:RNA polymerase sigma factor (sigma-70 family)
MASAAPAFTNNPQTSADALSERLYNAHRSHLLGIARRNSATNEDAEEALHDAFILFIDHYDPSEGSPPLAWLTLTLKRRCWAIYKRQRRAGSYQPQPTDHPVAPSPLEARADPARPPDELAEVAESVERVREAFAQLKPQERTALALLALGYTYREICGITGWTYTKVNRCIAEGRVELRRQRDQEESAVATPQRPGG